MDCAPRKFSFQCQIANFPQLFLLYKNQQCLWKTDNILNGTSGEEKKSTPESICFCCWTKINSTKLKTEQRKAFWIQWMFCLLHNLVHTTWSRAGGWTRALLLRAVRTRTLLRGLCQFSGADSWRDRSVLCGGTATVSISARAWRACCVRFPVPARDKSGPISVANESPRRGWAGSLEAAHWREASCPGCLMGKDEDQNGSSTWAFMLYFELQSSFSICSALHLT